MGNTLRLLLPGALLLFLAAASPATPSDPPLSSPGPPILFHDPVAEVHAFTSHADLLLHLHRRGGEAVPLVNLSRRNGFFSPEGSAPRMDLIRRLLDEGRLEEIRRRAAPLPLKESLFGPDTFLRAAHGLGLLSSLRWVMPRPGAIDAGIFGKLREFFAGRGDRDSAGTLVFEEGVISGRFLGLPVRLGPLSEPVRPPAAPAVVVFDLSFFPALYDASGEGTLLGVFSRAVSALREARLAVGEVAIVRSSYGGEAPLMFAFLGDALESLVRKPGLLDDRVDPRWLAVNGAFERERIGDIDGAADIVFGLAKEHPEYAYPLYHLAVLHLRRRDYDSCLALLQRASSLDPLYRGGYVESAVFAERAGRSDFSRHLLEEAVAGDPQDPLPLYLLGNLHFHEGRCGEADSAYRRLSDMLGGNREIDALVGTCREAPDPSP